MVSRSALDQSLFEKFSAALLLVITLLLAVLLVKAPGTSDLEMFLTWGTLAQDHGLVGGYEVMVDKWPETVLGGDRSAGGGEYPPLGFAWIYVVCELADVFGVPHFLAFKLALLASGYVSTGMMWCFSRSIAIAAVYQGAIVLSASGLGYTDVVAAPLLIGALWAIRDERPVFGSILFLVSVLLKWQALVIAPFLLIHMLRISDLPSTARLFFRPLTFQLVAVGVLAALCTGAIFGTYPPRAFLSALRHPYLSANTLNMPWVATFALRLLGSPDYAVWKEVTFLALPVPYLLPFKAIFFILFGFVLARYIHVAKTFSHCMFFCVLGVVTYGVWNSAVHENHWFIAMVPAFLLASESRAWPERWIVILVAVMFNVNLFVFYGITGREVVARTVGLDLSVPLALVFTTVWLLFLWHGLSIAPVKDAHLSPRGDAIQP